MPERDLPELRNALPEDAEKIFELLQQPARRRLILPRTRKEIAACAENYIVAERHGVMVGCVTLKDYGGGLREIRSLVVAPDAAGQGIGTLLVEQAVSRAIRTGAQKVFALTYRPHLFERLNFQRVPKTEFPQKVWDDCRRCPERDHCSEVALLLQCGGHGSMLK